MDSISIMEDQLSSLQDFVSSAFLRMSSEIELLKANLAKLKAEQMSSEEDRDCKDFTYISHERIDNLIKDENDIPNLPGQQLFEKYKIVVNKNPSDKKDPCIIATDGSLRQSNQRSAAAYAVTFSGESRYNVALMAANASNSTQAEILGVCHALKCAKQFGLRKVILLIDNQACIAFASTAIQLTARNSCKIQEIAKANPIYMQCAKTLHNTATAFDFIAFVWVKSHIGRQNTFEELNDIADKMAQDKSSELLDKLIGKS